MNVLGRLTDNFIIDRRRSSEHTRKASKTRHSVTWRYQVYSRFSYHLPRARAGTPEEDSDYRIVSEQVPDASCIFNAIGAWLHLSTAHFLP
jgi:hypothetical protein